MACDTCMFLNHVSNHVDQKGAKLEPCSQQFNCNPYFKDGKDTSVMLTESYCGTCNKLQNACECPDGVRSIRQRKIQTTGNRASKRRN